MHERTVSQLSAGLRSGEFSSVELTRAFLDRIDRHDSSLNCFISVDADRALAQAASADERIRRKEAGSLTGIPIAHKDIFCTRGLRTTCGSRILENFVAPYDAAVVERLERAGVVTLGKTNLDEFAMGSSNENSYFGVTRNPWDLKAVPGGSSGGSAAAVAARLCAAATGTDTGGSIRQPASHCGVTGIKPTYGRVSRWGMVAFASSLDQGGVLAQNAEDAALLLQAIAGFDDRDSTSADVAVPDYRESLMNELDGLRIGLPREYFEEGLDPSVAAVVEAAVQVLREQGASVHDITLPNADLAVAAYYVVASAEASSNLARFDGVRFGYRCQNPTDILDLYTRTRGEGFGAEVKRRIMVGTYVLSAGYYDAYYLKAQQVRRVIRNDFSRAFEQVDVIAGPVSPTPAFAIGEKAEDPVTMYLSDVYTISPNLAGLPSMSVPAGIVSGRPVGLQLIGNYFREGQLLQVGHRYQQSSSWHEQMPEGYRVRL